MSRRPMAAGARPRRSSTTCCWANRTGCGSVSYTHLDVYKRQLGAYGFEDAGANKTSVLAVIANVQRTLIICRWKGSEGVNALDAAQAGAIERGAAAGAVELHIAGAAIAAEFEDQIDACSVRGARIDFLLVPTAGHLGVDLIHVPAEAAGKIVISDGGWSIRCHLRLGAPGDRSAVLLAVAGQEMCIRDRG